MKSARSLALIVAAAMVLFFGLWQAAAQDNRDNQPHIQPKNMPSPAPEQQPEQPPAPAAEEPGYSSSKDSQINLDAHPVLPEPARKDDRDFSPYDPHRAAKDVEVGKYYLKLKNYRAALERFNDALVYKPNDAEATLGLAQTQEKLDLPGQAFLNYAKCLEILPNGPLAVQAQQGLKRVQPQLKLERNGDPGLEAAHDLDVGETYLTLNNFAAAHERFEDALRLAPQFSLLSFRMAQSLQGLQRLDEARLYYRKYLQMQPEGRYAEDAKKAIANINDFVGKEK